MSTTIVRYTPRDVAAADENERLVREAFDELSDLKPDGIHYATFRLDDGTFVHLFQAGDDADDGLLQTLPAFQRFAAGIAERCEIQPVVAAASVVGVYGFESA